MAASKNKCIEHEEDDGIVFVRLCAPSQITWSIQVVFNFSQLVGEVGTNQPETVICRREGKASESCHCSFTSERRISARCRFKNNSNFSSDIVKPSQVIYLDLSDSGLTGLPVSQLSLFDNLLVMNLSGNPSLDLSSLNLTNVFPRLAILDVSGIPHWLNSSHVKESLSMLQVIRGTPLDGQCLRCFLRKNSSISNIPLGAGPWMNAVSNEMAEAMKPPLLKYSSCYGNIIHFKDQYHINFQSLGYDLSCESVDFRCFNGYSKLSFFHNYDVEPLNKCWDEMNQSSIFLFVLATVAITLNLTVVIVTVRSKVLRDNVAQFLVSNVAIGDMIMALYLILITATRASVTYREMMELLDTHFCYFVGFVSMMSQGISAFSSFIVSIERYLAVVYCMYPNIRIFPDVAKACLAAIVFVSFVFSILPFTVLHGIYVPDSHCTPISEPTSGVLEYMLIPGSLVMILYFSTLPMYVHMYISVRLSSQTVGVQREGKVALKIALIVFSNMVFFSLPMLFLTLVNYTALGTIFTIIEKGIFWKTFMYYSFATNACLNPILFAFRNEKFRQELKRQLHLAPAARVAVLQPSSRASQKQTTRA